MGYDAPPMQMRIGQSPASPPLSRYVRRFDLFELRLEGGAPRKRTIDAMLKDGEGKLAFSVTVPKALGALEGDVTEADVASSIETARALSAAWLLVRTPPSARPSARTRARLGRVIELLKPAGIPIAWEPTGLLAEAEADVLARTLGVTLVRDPGRDDLPEGEFGYGRIQSLGSAGRIRGSSIERAAERLSRFESAFVIIEGLNAVRAAAELRGMVADVIALLAEGENAESGEHDLGSVNGGARLPSSTLDDEDEDEDDEDEDGDDDLEGDDLEDDDLEDDEDEDDEDEDEDDKEEDGRP